LEAEDFGFNGSFRLASEKEASAHFEFRKPSTKPLTALEKITEIFYISSQALEIHY
jgi:hypothetical protein